MGYLTEVADKDITCHVEEPQDIDHEPGNPQLERVVIQILNCSLVVNYRHRRRDVSHNRLRVRVSEKVAKAGKRKVRTTSKRIPK